MDMSAGSTVSPRSSPFRSPPLPRLGERGLPHAFPRRASGFLIRNVV